MIPVPAPEDRVYTPEAVTPAIHVVESLTMALPPPDDAHFEYGFTELRWKDETGNVHMTLTLDDIGTRTEGPSEDPLTEFLAALRPIGSTVEDGGN